MKKIIQNIFIGKILLLLLFAFTCYNVYSQELNVMNRARIKPTLVKLNARAEQQFYVLKNVQGLATAYATNKVTWYVNGIVGGDESVGKITKDGLYTAPKKITGLSEISIEAKVFTTNNKTVRATVLINGERPVYKTMADWSEQKSKLEHLNDPTDIVLEKNGNILIADNRIKRFSNDGKFINEFGGLAFDADKSISGASSLAINYLDETVYATDRSESVGRIKAFTDEGTYLRDFAPKGNTDGKIMTVRGIAFNSKHQLYVSDIDNMRISVFDQSGKFIRTLGNKGAFPGELNVPYGIATDSNNDVFVASYFGPCQKFSDEGNLIIDFLYPNPPEGQIYFYDIASDIYDNVYVIVKGSQKFDGEYNVAKDEDGNPVHIMKFNNNGDFVANIQLSEVDRNALRLAVDDYGKIYVLYNDKDKIGVEVLAQ
ncbi:MAG: NHL repeat-containing protein [Draconibacterium sp.]